MILKVCPVLLRETCGVLDILAFRHPLAGTQIVKGTVEPGESLEAAAIREMREESGVVVTVDRPLGQLDLKVFRETWHVFLCRSAPSPDRPLPDHWQHRAEDDGGHVFSFFWHPMNRAPDDSWHPDFSQALRFIAGQLRDRS